MTDTISINFPETCICKTILIVDDQLIIRELSETIFSDIGFNVITACDGQDAIDKFKDNIDSIDIILMDIVMPIKDGFIAYEEISEFKPNVKIVFMSGYNTNQLDELHPNINLVTKPFNYSVIVNKVTETLDGVYQ